MAGNWKDLQEKPSSYAPPKTGSGIILGVNKPKVKASKEDDGIYMEGREMPTDLTEPTKNVKPKRLASGGKVSSASKRADGIATRGKTRGKCV